MTYRFGIAASSFLLCVLLLSSAPLLAQGNCLPTDLAAYFVPSYSGWDTAVRFWTDSNGGSSHERWYSYAPNKYAHIKFGNPQSVETFDVTSNWIFITAENDQNNTNVSRIWVPGTYGAGLQWIRRTGYTCFGCSHQDYQACQLNHNIFDPCHNGENFYTNCQFTNSTAAHCFLYNAAMIFYQNYNYGYSVGTLPSVVLSQDEDDRTSELYYYGLGRGFLRFESYDANGILTFWAQQTGEAANQPIPDQACFHP